MLSITSLLGLIALASSASATTMEFYASSDCSGNGGTITDPDHTGCCSQLDGNVSHSFKTTAVDGGCSVTVYSDPNCFSDITADLERCLTVEESLLSYSIDC